MITVTVHHNHDREKITVDVYLTVKFSYLSNVAKSMLKRRSTSHAISSSKHAWCSACW